MVLEQLLLRGNNIGAVDGTQPPKAARA